MNKDKKNSGIIYFLGIIFLITIINSYTALAVECPFGIINDSAPGQCGRYIDENSNALCDLSEPCNTTYETPIGEVSGEEMKSMTVDQISQIYSIDSNILSDKISEELDLEISKTQNIGILHDNYGFKMSTLKAIISEIQNNTNIESNKDNDVLALNQESNKPKSKYNFLIITIITILSYIITWTLSKLKVISLITHRKIWNWILLISFILTTIFAIIWLLNMDLGLRIAIPLNTSFWHIETGIVMIIASIFHALWHVKYYSNFKKS